MPHGVASAKVRNSVRRTPPRARLLYICTREQLPRPASTTSVLCVHNFRALRPQLLRGSDKNYFQALEINFKSLEIYFRGLEIYFRASEKVLFPAAKDFIPCRGGFYMAGDMICSRGFGPPDAMQMPVGQPFAAILSRV